jgi:signal transduction histidine kinase
LAEVLQSLAHDLRAPLGVVSSAVSELGAELDGVLGDDTRLVLSLVTRGARRIGRIADAVSLAASLDAGTFQLRLGPIDLVEILRAATAAAVLVEPRREVEITSDLPGEPCPAVGDAEQLRRAVAELVVNAVRHARRSAHLRLDLDAGAARVAIEDDGPGVPEAHRKTLFHRFAPRRDRAGLAMGLSLVRDVIESHGGRIALEASTLPPGRPDTVGARFVLWLPREARG